MEQQLRAQILIHKQEAKRDIGNGASLLKSQSLPPVSDTPSPTKPHLLILLNQFHPLETKYSIV